LKLLVDENLPPGLVQDLADLFPDSAHVSSAGLDRTPDAMIWEYAKTRQFTFLTKDKDFANLSLAWGAPPKVILLQTGNCSTAKIVRIIRKNAVRHRDPEGRAGRKRLDSQAPGIWVEYTLFPIMLRPCIALPCTGFLDRSLSVSTCYGQCQHCGYKEVSRFHSPLLSQWRQCATIAPLLERMSHMTNRTRVFATGLCHRVQRNGVFP
jgi:predicted nuclease of predicted toxin-antitoxin system